MVPLRPPIEGAIRIVTTTDILRSEVENVLNCPEFARNYTGPTLSASHRSILITGATGFLGTAVMARLLADPAIDEIYCLVRAENPTAGLERVRRVLIAAGAWQDRNASRIQIICGDLSQPRMGLDEATLQRLCDSVTQVVHAAAHLNFISTYQNLKATNVDSTLFLIREFCGRGIPLWHLSSIGVITGEGFPSELGEDRCYLQNRAEMIGGYAQSKWVSDQIAFQLQTRGWPITILRPAHVIDRQGRYADPAPIVEFFFALMRDRVAPAIDFTFYVTPLDDLAELMATLLTTGGDTPPRCLHLVSRPVTYAAALQRLECHVGSIERIPLDAWKQRIKKACLEHRREFAALLPYVYYLSESRLKLGHVRTDAAAAAGWVLPASDAFESYLLSISWVTASGPDATNAAVAGKVLPDSEEAVDLYDLQAIGNLADLYGSVFKARYKSREVVVVLDARIVRHILVDHFLDYQKGQGMMGQFGEILGKGLFTSDGEQWEQDRRLVAPPFHNRSLEKFESRFEEHTQRLLNQLDAGHGRPIDVHRMVSRYSLSLAADCLFSVPSVDDFPFDVIDELKYLVKEFRQNLKDVRRECFLKLQANYRAFRRYVQTLIAARRAVTIPHDDLFEHLRNQPTVTEEQLFGQISSILAASYDTTNVSLTFVLMQLARSPVEQQRLRDEINGAAPGTRLQDLLRLPRCVAFIDETLRLYPPVWSIPRYSVRQHQVAGFDLPGQMDYLIYTWLIHRSPRYWSDPDVFRPERFLAPTDEPRDKSAYHPFSLGRRTCIGMRFAQYEILHLVKHLLCRYRIVPVSEDFETVPLYPVLSTREPVQLIFEKLPCPPHSPTC